MNITWKSKQSTMIHAIIQVDFDNKLFNEGIPQMIIYKYLTDLNTNLYFISPHGIWNLLLNNPQMKGRGLEKLTTCQ